MLSMIGFDVFCFVINPFVVYSLCIIFGYLLFGHLKFCIYISG